nr:glutamine synthetase [Candidatus Woesebacteria bacterium]
MNDSLRSFSQYSYMELEAKNLSAKKSRANHVSQAEFEKEYRSYLKKESGIKAVTVCFSNIEGRFHMLDYDKQHFLQSADNLTFDGSSVRGFTELAESDLRLVPDWSSLRWLPADVFGPGKVLLFASIADREHVQYPTDFRGLLKSYSEELYKKEKIEAFAAPEIEGFLLAGVDAERNYDEKTGFSLLSTGGYYQSLPNDALRLFIDVAAEAQRALGFENEKDHPEVAPSQFELNFKYGSLVEIADQIQLYKLVCRQVAAQKGMTASFLPKPLAGINGSGMHINFSLAKNGKNIFYSKKGENSLSAQAWSSINKILNHAPELCLIFNSSVNAYRRLDPNFEAPNQIKVSPTDRGSMVRLPVGNEHTTRIEVRSVAPDANPYLTVFALLKTIFSGTEFTPAVDKRPRVRFLPGTIYEALRLFKSSPFIGEIMGEVAQSKFAAWKQLAADRSPKELGSHVKTSEVIYHHEVTNQI